LFKLFFQGASSKNQTTLSKVLNGLDLMVAINCADLARFESTSHIFYELLLIQTFLLFRNTLRREVQSQKSNIQYPRLQHIQYENECKETSEEKKLHQSEYLNSAL